MPDRAVLQRMRVSADLFRRHWPTIAGDLDCQPTLGAVETDPGAVLRDLDLSTGMDYVARTTSGGRLTVAARVQHAPHLYASHTIRLQVASGEPTEWFKLARAHADDTLMPQLHVQLYVDTDGSLVGWGAVRTRALVGYLLDREADSKAYEVRLVGSDGNRFIVAWWAQLRTAGVTVTTRGEDRLVIGRSAAGGPTRKWVQHSDELDGKRDEDPRLLYATDPALPPVPKLQPGTGRCTAHSHWAPGTAAGDAFRCTVTGCPGAEKVRV